MGLPKDRIAVKLAVLSCTDIGKIGVPEAILLSAGVEPGRNRHHA